MKKHRIIVNMYVCMCVFIKTQVLNLADLQSVVRSEILACTFLVVPPTGGRATATAKAKAKLAAHLTYKGSATATVTEGRCRPRSGRCCAALCCVALATRATGVFLGQRKQTTLHLGGA